MELIEGEAGEAEGVEWWGRIGKTARHDVKFREERRGGLREREGQGRSKHEI